MRHAALAAIAAAKPLWTRGICLLLALFMAGWAFAGDGWRQQLDFATAADCMGGAPPPWLTVAVPHRWQDGKFDTVPNGLFRLEFDWDGRQPLAIVSRGSTLWQTLVVNGKVASQPSDAGRLPPKGWQRVQHFTILPSSLVPGRNVIEVHQINYPATPRALDAVWLGEVDRAAREVFWARGFALAPALMLLLVAFVLMLWQPRAPAEHARLVSLSLAACIAVIALGLWLPPRAWQAQHLLAQTVMACLTAWLATGAWLAARINPRATARFTVTVASGFVVAVGIACFSMPLLHVATLLKPLPSGCLGLLVLAAGFGLGRRPASIRGAVAIAMVAAVTAIALWSAATRPLDTDTSVHVAALVIVALVALRVQRASDRVAETGVA